MKGKQFRPRSPISNTAAYPFVRYQHAAQFKTAANQLNTLVQFFNLNTIAPFMYDAELQFFVADYRQRPCQELPFLKFALEHMFERHCLQVGPNVNRPNPQEDDEGEWVDIDDDSDDEISFPNVRTQVISQVHTVNDTELSHQTTRQQEEYQDQRAEQQQLLVDNGNNRLNESLYLSAEEGNYDEYDEYDSFQEGTQEQFYTPYQYPPITDGSLDYTAQTHSNLVRQNQVVGSHALEVQSVQGSQNMDSKHKASEAIYPDAGYETEIGFDNRTQAITHTSTSYHTDRYTHVTEPDEFMGQFDDVEQIDYATANQIDPQIVSPENNYAKPRTVLIHNRPQVGYQQPLVVHQVHNMFGATSLPKKPLPPPRWPVKEVSPGKQGAHRTATITSFFHEDDLKTCNMNTPQESKSKQHEGDDTRAYALQFTQSDAANDRDLMAGNNRRGR